MVAANPAVPGDQFTIVGQQAGHGPAELCHAGSDLGHLVRAVDLGIASIGAEPVDRPSFNLARRKDQVNGVALSGRRTSRSALGDASVRIGIRNVGKSKAPARGVLRAQFFDDQWVGQWGQIVIAQNPAAQGKIEMALGWQLISQAIDL
jgi:hypothetical protein